MSAARRAAGIVLRLAAAIPGGYALSAALVALGAGALARLGMPRSEAVVLAAMLGFVLYLVVLLWAFSDRSLLRVCLATAGGSALGWALLAWMT